MIESILLCTVPVWTFRQEKVLTNASGFFFENDSRLFLVTSRHVMYDKDSGHSPDRLEIELHVDASNMSRSTGFSVPLFEEGRPLWRQGLDSAGEIDVAVIEIERPLLPKGTLLRAFGPQHLQQASDRIEVGSSVLVVGYPLGFHDNFNHLPVVRQAGIASSFGMRFQGQGYFLTDARTHRGASGAPVVMRAADVDSARGDLPWMLLGVHSSRLDVGSRDRKLDEALGLNCAWYADILLTLSAR